MKGSRIPILMMLSAVTVALLMMIANNLVLKNVREAMLRQAAQHQENALRAFWQLLSAKGTEFRIVDGALYAGSYRINGNNEIPDQIFSATGSRATVFMGNARVATNVLLTDGRRALGTRLDGAAYQAVFREGLPYRGETLILGEPYLAAYDPIRSSRGEVIGALFVGMKKGEFLATWEAMSLKIYIINRTLAGIFVLFAFLLLNERRRSEQAMRKQLDFLQILSDTIPSPIFSRNAEGVYHGCNQAFLSFVGLSREELIGKSVHEVWPPELARRYAEMDRDLVAGGSISQLYEFQVPGAAGSLRDVVFHRAAIRNRDGAYQGLVGVMLDITERKAAEEELNNAYRRTSDILEFLPDGTFVVDSDYRVIAWNRALEQMTGVRKEEILGAGRGEYAIPFYGERRDMLIDFLDAGDQALTDRYHDGKREGNTISGEITLIRNGEERILRGTATPLFDRQGNRVGGIETLRDITDLRKAAQERQKLELQTLHSRMMESLLVQLSHDLKTPLTPLFALLPIIARKVEDPQLKKMLEICRHGAAQIQGLADKALDLVRLSSGGERNDLHPVALAGAAREAVQSVLPSLEKKGVSCRNLIDPELLVLGNGAHLELLFRNLLSNASRYAFANGSVEITAQPKGDLVEVAVQDHGEGLAPEHTKLIFYEFFKADAARHDLNTQGLGLAICQRIVANHGGAIRAESGGKGRGTTILFTLRRAGRSKEMQQTGTATGYQA